MKKLGIIGGMGPLATAYFYELIVNMTDAKCDQEHMEVIMISKSSIPDRTNYILGRSIQNPELELCNTINDLVSLGADIIAIPCVTSHYFYSSIIKKVTVPIINIVQEIAMKLVTSGVQIVGLMATEGTVSCRLFQEELKQYGIDVVVPNNKEQQVINNFIYDFLKVAKDINMVEFEKITESLKMRGAQAILLGCTELSLINKKYNLGAFYIDALNVLAERAIIYCDGPIKDH